MAQLVVDAGEHAAQVSRTFFLRGVWVVLTCHARVCFHPVYRQIPPGGVVAKREPCDWIGFLTEMPGHMREFHQGASWSTWTRPAWSYEQDQLASDRLYGLDLNGESGRTVSQLLREKYRQLSHANG